MRHSPKPAILVGLLTYLVFTLGPVSLKLAGKLTASWGWVLVALWGPAAFVLAFAVLSLLVFPFFKKPRATAAESA